MPASRRSTARESSSVGASKGQDDAAPLHTQSSPKASIPVKVGPASVAIDLGSYSIRIYIAKSNGGPSIITQCPNALVRSSQKRHSGSSTGPLAGPQILQKCTNFGSLSVRQPMDRGMIVDWPTQKLILDTALKDALSKEKGITKSDQRLLEGRDVIITEAYFNLPDLQAALDLLLLEEYGAAKILRCSPALLIPYQPRLFLTKAATPTIKKRARPECLCIIDLGHNATHVVPVVGDSIVWKAVRRHIISQRILTNLLKEALSFRQWDMMDEGWLVGHIKRRCCFVASRAGRRGDAIEMSSQPPSQWSYAGMVEMCAGTVSHKNPLTREYVLPDYSFSSAKGKLGYIRGEKDKFAEKDLDIFIAGAGPSSHPANGKNKKREEEEGEDDKSEEAEDDSDDDFDEDSPAIISKPKKKPRVEIEEEEDSEQVLVLERERFQVPEAMFDPGTIGLDDAPLHQVVESSISACKEDVQGPLWANIVLVGGGAKMQGIKERLYNELRPLASADGPLHIWVAEDPSLSAIEGAQALLEDSHRLLRNRLLSADEYSIQTSRERFGSWSGISTSSTE